MRVMLIIVQVMTFVLLGGLLCAEGHYRLGAAQLLLAIVQGVIYA